MTPGQAANHSAPLLTPAEVASAFRVDPKTVTRWAKAGKLSSIRTLGGHRRYLEAEIRAILDIPADESSVGLRQYGDGFHGQ
jgi:excisionase family DNA binding protein